MNLVFTLNRNKELEFMLLSLLGDLKDHEIFIIVHDNKKLSNFTEKYLKSSWRFKNVHLIYEPITKDLKNDIFLLKPLVLEWFSRNFKNDFLFLDCDVYFNNEHRHNNRDFSKKLICDKCTNPPEKTKVYHSFVLELNKILSRELLDYELESIGSSWIIGGSGSSLFWEEWKELSEEITKKSKENKNPLINFYGQHYNEELALSVLQDSNYNFLDSKTENMGVNIYFKNENNENDDPMFVHYDSLSFFPDEKRSIILEKSFGINLDSIKKNQKIIRGKLYEFANPKNIHLINKIFENPELLKKINEPDILHLFSGFRKTF